MLFSRSLIMYFLSNDFKMQLVYSRNPENKVLIIGDSLVRGLVCDNCDVAAVPGGRSEDLPRILSVIPIQCYDNFIILIGANGLETRPKQGRLRCKRSVPEIVFDILAAAEHLNYLGKVFVMGVPHRIANEATYLKIKLLNQALQDCAIGWFLFVGLGTKMSSRNIVGDDKVHLSAFGSSQLRSVIVNKIFRKFPPLLNFLLYFLS